MADEKERIVTTLNRTLRERYGTDVIFGGSFGLYLKGIVLDRDFHDIDVRVVGIDPNIVRAEGVESEVPVHFLGYTEVPLECEEVDVCGEKVLVYTPETIIRCKKHTIAYNETRKIKTEFTRRKSEKDRKDLEYIKEKYGLE